MTDYLALSKLIKQWGKELGFQALAITDIDLSQHEAQLQKWLDAGYHGSMGYMASHGMKRARPAELVPGTQRIISVRMDYLPPHAQFAKTLKQDDKAYISRYALGRDYHKVMRNKLKQLGKRIEQHCENLGFRPFVDSAPVLERQLAEKAGLGFIGKNSLLLNKQAGSWFFLGELFVDIPLPIDIPVKEVVSDGCGNCVACMTMCPTGAIVAPYVVDARKCISYLTIESDEPIPEPLRPLMGNRIYGCDDCQLVCPWNRFANITEEPDFNIRSALNNPDLLTLFAWDEATFLRTTEGSPIRRIGYLKWLRNIAVALGNAAPSQAIVEALKAKLSLHLSAQLDEHIEWAIDMQHNKVANRKTARLIKTIEKGLPRDA